MSERQQSSSPQSLPSSFPCHGVIAAEGPEPRGKELRSVRHRMSLAPQCLPQAETLRDLWEPQSAALGEGRAAPPHASG